MTATALAFDLPTALEATEPPEARGLPRDGVRLLVADRNSPPPTQLDHRRFHDLPDILRPGDLVVVNTSATLPAALGARRRDGRALRVHAAMPAPGLDGDTRWLVELRAPDGAHPVRDGRAGERLDLDGGASAELLAPYAGGPRVWLARFDVPVTPHLQAHGAPIRYGYVDRPWPLADYQTAFALHPGSAEMPSAGRPFTPELITRLVASGIAVAPIVLHCGVSSPERHEGPLPERFHVPEATAREIGLRDRIFAVGTTVVRALESAVDDDGRVRAVEGWTSHVVGPDTPPRVVDGLITGWHEPEASHLDLLEAVAGPELLRASYEAAIAHGYLWHEFGDSHLVLR